MKEIKKKLDAALIEYREAKKIFKEKESIWWGLKKEFERLDYEQALIDRLKKVKVGDEKIKDIKLTHADILKVAKTLGIDIKGD